jgi:hypothetical protein
LLKDVAIEICREEKVGMEIPKMRFYGVCKNVYLINVWLDEHGRVIETLVSIVSGWCHGVMG